mmetsp:Transcript_71514/g.197480  ORF Transcript_71514/g.197480 Transcript_71514/m.197480 type:complete len:82 (-) Transcript_71514:365-610(-)
MLLQFPHRAVSMDPRPPDLMLPDASPWECDFVPTDEAPWELDFTLEDPSPGNLTLREAPPPWDDMPRDTSPAALFSRDFML